VLSSDAARIAVGAAASIVDWGGDRPIAGRVASVEPSAFTRISALGIEEQRVNVIVAVDDPPPALGDGYRVEARIAIWRGDNVLAIPSSAVFRDQQRWAVYVVSDGRAHRRSIEVGHRGQTEIEVLAGLEDQAVVVAHPRRSHHGRRPRGDALTASARGAQRFDLGRGPRIRDSKVSRCDVPARLSNTRRGEPQSFHPDPATGATASSVACASTSLLKFARSTRA